VVPGGWSIANEMNFYFLFPFLLKNLRRYIWIISIVSFLYFISLIFLPSIFGNFPSYLIKNYFYLFLPNQFNVFVFGMLAAYWIEESSFKAKDFICLIVYLLFVLTSCIYFNDFNHVKTILVGIFFSCIIYLFIKFKIFNLELISTIGQMTYSSYLLHFGILILLSKFFTEYLNYYSAFLLVSMLTFYSASILKPYTEDIWVGFANKMFQKKL
jgi:peptidoglycan/LPS O-acetylase OafA/YrhL